MQIRTLLLVAASSCAAPALACDNPPVAVVPDGNTALMLAANRGFLDIVKRLLASGADVNIRAKDGWTALAAAEMIGDTEIAELIKKAGAKR